jgi:hypothetical protein
MSQTACAWRSARPTLAANMAAAIARDAPSQPCQLFPLHHFKSVGFSSAVGSFTQI